MFYKYNSETAEWQVGQEVHFADNTKISKHNKKAREGFKWHDTPPAAYLDYIATLREDYVKEDDLPQPKQSLWNKAVTSVKTMFTSSSN